MIVGFLIRRFPEGFFGMDGDSGVSGCGDIGGDVLRLSLPAVLDYSYSGELYSEFRDRAGFGLVVDFSDVVHVGGLCFQIFLSASRLWGSEGLSLLFSGCSESVLLGFERMGICVDDLSVPEGTS